MGHRIIRNIVEELFDALYPKDIACFCCGREIPHGTGGICDACRTSLRSARPYPPPKHLDGCVSAYDYDCPIKYAIQNLKYGRKTYLADILGRLLPYDETLCAEWIIPVPLHPRRLRTRGFNQSEMLALALSERTGIPVAKGLLKRTVYTEPQARLSGDERRKNLNGAFSCTETITSSTILLVDDVITTGSTLSACAAELKRHGARRVFACTVASAAD
ncbi:MAG: ComF family protein [Lachnospiraceae bacterium]|nr:ComF family protein [Lachnospiraceae bacterium]